MCYFRGSSLKTVPPACNLTRHCLLFQSVAHFPEVLLTFQNHCSLSGIIALFPESLLTFQKCCSLSGSVAYFFKNK